ncbi:MAG: hypothetical protein H6591_13945 [Flavobacteriales bacterium]|nr:hypothetical protein [Flavobacteriales bacterium]
MYRTLSLLSMTVCAALLNAQPVLQFATHAPAVGTSYTLRYSAYVSPGNSGAGQTWNLGALTTDSTAIIALVSPGGTPDGTYFPASTVAQTGQEAIMYFRAASDGVYFAGSTAAGTRIVNSDQGLYLPFPCTMGTTWTDQESANFESDEYSVARHTSITAQADGYGQALLPTGMVSDVLRVHWQATTVDSVGFLVFTSVQDNYLYYSANVSYPVAQLVHTAVTFMGSTIVTEYAQWVGDLSTGTQDDATADASLTVYPVPADESITIEDAGTHAPLAQLLVLDNAGRTVRQLPTGARDGQRIIMNVRGLRPDSYTLVAVDQRGGRRSRRIIVQ